jgi:hypothetical protein
MKETIETADGDRIEVEGEKITEDIGIVFVWEEWPDSLGEAFTSDMCEKYRGATIVEE